MNAEAWGADAVEPPAALPAALEQYLFAPPGALARGPEPGDVVILIEIETYSG